MVHQSENEDTDLAILTPEFDTRIDQDPTRENVNADISLLAFNATGELRFIGPSSGSFFAKHALNYAKSLIPDNDSASSQNASKLVGPVPEAVTRVVSPPVQRFLLESYLRWTHPLYALFDAQELRYLMDRGRPLSFAFDAQLSTKDNASRAIFLLLLSIGAVFAEQSHLWSMDQEDENRESYKHAAVQGLRSEQLFSAAANILDRLTPALNPRMFMIQIILLIAIYGSYKSSGNSVWQLSGLAMRVS
jgi:hypothetical protein